MKTRYFLPMVILVSSVAVFVHLMWFYDIDDYYLNQVVAFVILIGGGILSALIMLLGWIMGEVMN